MRSVTVLLAFVVLAASQEWLWRQADITSGNGLRTHFAANRTNLATGSPPSQTIIADDFDVPSGQFWIVTTVQWYGFYLPSGGPAAVANLPLAWTVQMYNTSASLPSAKIYEQNIVPFTQANDSFPAFQLPTPFNLTSGKYWLAVIPTIQGNATTYAYFSYLRNTSRGYFGNSFKLTFLDNSGLLVATTSPYFNKFVPSTAFNFFQQDELLFGVGGWRNTTTPTSAPTSDPMASSTAPMASSSAPMASSSAPMASSSAPMASSSTPVASSTAPMASSTAITSGPTAAPTNTTSAPTSVTPTSAQTSAATTGGCTLGARGCACTGGNGCDPGLTCKGGICQQPVTDQASSALLLAPAAALLAASLYLL